MTMYSVFESLEDNTPYECQPAPDGQTANSRNLVLIWLEKPVEYGAQGLVNLVSAHYSRNLGPTF